MVVLTLTASACGDRNELEPTIPVVDESVRLYSLNGSEPGSPNGLALISSTGAGRFGPVVFRASPNFFFDLAVDFADAGGVRLYPVRLVGSVLGGARQVGLRPYEIPFEQLETAPTEGYEFDESFELAEGDVFAAVSVGAPICTSGFNLIPNIYAKLRVEEIDEVTRSVVLRVVADPNCGFRRLTPPAAD